MRLVNQVQILLTEDSDQLFKYIDQKRNLDDSLSTTITQRTGSITLAASETDTEFDFNDVTDAKYVYLVADAEVTVRINGVGAPALELKPLPAATAGTALGDYQKVDQPARLFMGPTSVQSLHFSNPDGSNSATVYVALVGEAV